MPNREEVTVSVDDEHAAEIHEVAERLTEVGMSVDGLLEEIGVITGSVDGDIADRLMLVEGVEHVEHSREYELAPPDSDIQ